MVRSQIEMFKYLQKNISSHDIEMSGKIEEKPTYNPFSMDNVTKMMENKDIKTIIHDYYIKENAGITDGIDKLLAEKNDYTVRFIMLQLEREPAWKYEFERLNESESILYLIHSNDSIKQRYEYSDQLVNEFKNVLKEVEE